MIREIAYEMRVLRKGALHSALTWEAGDAPQVDMDSSAELKSSLQGSFLVSRDFDPLTDELQPVIVQDGQETPLGIFPVASCGYTGQGSSRRMKVEAYDRCWLVQTTKAERPVFFPAGSRYMDAVESLLTGAGIVRVLKTASDAVFATDREDWDTGTDYLSIVNQLLSEIVYLPLWFDGDGIARLEPYVPPRSTAIKRQYSASDIRRLAMLPDYEDETDLFNAPNVFICICSNADRTQALTATAVNDSPLSGKSTFRRGRRIVQTVRVNEIADQASLQAYANKLKFDSMVGAYTLRFSVPAAGGHGVSDVIAVDHPDAGGIYVETGWSLPMTAGESMTLTAKKAVIQ